MASVKPVIMGTLLRRYRVAANMTQAELAERAGLSVRAISALECGSRRAPRKDTLELLASALGLSPMERGKLEAARRGANRETRPATARGAAATAARQGSMPLVGREREMALLERHLAGDAPPLVLIAGEPGIGKSRLLAEAAERAGEQGWTVLAGGCHRGSGQEPYAPFASTLARFLAARTRSRQRLDTQGCPWLVRLLPEMVEYVPVPSPSWILPAEQERRLMFAAVARFLANVAGPAGTLLVLDDLHWAGADALDLLAYLVREAPRQSLCVVGAYRDTEVAEQDPLPMLLADLAREDAAVYATLAPLGSADAAQLLSNLLADEREDTRVPHGGILARAGGIPFYLVSCAQEAHAIRPDERGDVYGGEHAGAFRVPWSAAESIRQRVSLIPVAARDLLAVAAVAGRTVPRDVLLMGAKALGYNERATLHALDSALHARLLIEDAEGGYAFTHDLIRETVAGDLSRARQAALHRRIGDELERSAHPERRAAELAWHFAEGEAPARAAAYFLLAGDQAEASYAHGEATKHYAAAVAQAEALGDAVSEGAALEKLADVYYHLARYSDAYTCLERAIGLYRREGVRERLSWATAQLARAGDPLGRTEDSLLKLEQLFAYLDDAGVEIQGADNVAGGGESLETRAVRAASSLTPKTAARLYLCLTSRLLFLERYTEVYGPSERAIVSARAAGDRRIESLAYWFRAEAQRAEGKIGAAGASAAIARERALACGDLEALSMALGVAATVYEWQGEPLRAQELLSQRLEVNRQLGNPSYIGGTLCGLAFFALVLGEWGKARSYLEQSEEILRQDESSDWRLPAHESSDWRSPAITLALLDILQGRGAATGDDAVVNPDDVADVALHIWSLKAKAELDILAGRADAAGARLREVIEARHASRGTLKSYLLPLLAWSELERGGEPERAAEAVAQARALARTQQNVIPRADIERVDALIAMRLGRWDQARRALDAAISICQAMPFPYAEAKARYVNGVWYLARGMVEQALGQFAQALTICERLGEWPYRHLIEAALRAAPADEGRATIA